MNYNVRAQHVGPARPPLLHQHARVRSSVDELGNALGARGADDPRDRCVHERRAAASRAATARARSTSPPISTTCAASIRCAPASSSTAAGTAPTRPSNYLGTYTFESLEAFEANRPRSYTRRIGDPNIDYFNLQGAHLRAGRHPRAPQPDAEPGRALRGADARARLRQRRAALRRHLVARDRAAARRCAAAPASSTTGSAPNTYEQTLRVDGFRQRELNIADPSYPDPGRSRGLGAAGQPLPARRRRADAAAAPVQRRRRSRR